MVLVAVLVVQAAPVEAATEETLPLMEHQVLQTQVVVAAVLLQMDLLPATADRAS
jgi:hypothetical protein